jgi:hypothetical protein
MIHDVLHEDSASSRMRTFEKKRQQIDRWCTAGSLPQVAQQMRTSRRRRRRREHGTPTRYRHHMHHPDSASDQKAETR